MSELQIIKQQEVLGKDFTVYGTFDEPLFLAKDVAEWIDYSKRPDGSYQVSAMLAKIDEDEKVKVHTTVNNFNGGSNTWFLTENGLYEVLMLSTKPIAKEFKKEVKKILHDLRVGNSVLVPKTFSEALYLAAKQQEEIEKQQAMIEHQQSQIEQLDHAIEYSKVIDWKGWLLLKKQLNFKGNFKSLVKEIPLEEGTDFEKKVMGYDKYPTILISPDGEEKLIDFLEHKEAV